MRGAARRREAPTNNWHDFYEFTNEVKNFTGLARYYGLLAATFELRSDFWVLDLSERAKLLGIFRMNSVLTMPVVCATLVILNSTKVECHRLPTVMPNV